MTLALGMDDVGTRAQHLSDLHDLWTTGLRYMQAGNYHTDKEKEDMAELETALKFLEFHMTSEFRMTPYAQAINQLPSKGTDILGGRGTDLKETPNE